MFVKQAVGSGAPGAFSVSGSLASTSIRSLARMRLKEASAVFQSWLSLVAEARHRRDVLYRSMKRMENRHLSAAWLQWSAVVVSAAKQRVAQEQRVVAQQQQQQSHE